VATELSRKVVGELLALVAHDLRNPLSALHSNIGFLRSIQADPDPDFEDAIDDGLVSCDGLNHIIDNLDLLGRSLRDAMEGEAVRLDVLDLVRDVVAHTEAVATSHGVKLEVDRGAESADVRVRRELSARALSNVVRNAVQHAGPARRVLIGVSRQGGEVVVRVADQGAPLVITPELDPFSAEGQIEAKAVQRGRYGRGLGLLCARIAAEAEGWALSAEPFGSGNAFVLRRPVLAPSGE
jgi:signal transduction histidine kinase